MDQMLEPYYHMLPSILHITVFAIFVGVASGCALLSRRAFENYYYNDSRDNGELTTAWGFRVMSYTMLAVMIGWVVAVVRGAV